MKYNKQYRFTVFTEDATVDVNRFRWKLNMGSVLEQDADYLMSIESITTEMSGAVINMELCCIRCENVMSKYSWCSKAGSPVIFCGSPMAFANHSKDFFTYEVNRDILNSDFVLQIDNMETVGGVRPLGIATANYRMALTFVITEYRNN
jgi:hypothetical protein